MEAISLSARVARNAKLLIPVAFLIALSYVYLTICSASGTSFSDDILIKEIGQPDVADTLTSRTQFIREAVQWEIDGPFDDGPLRDMCSSKKWTPALTIRCEDVFGGVGNIRNYVLTCIRYAIEAGGELLSVRRNFHSLIFGQATSLVVPQIKARSEGLIELVTETTHPFTYIFDQDFFIASLSKACPQIKIIPVADFVAPVHKVDLMPRDLGDVFREDRVMDFPSTWRSLFDAWLVEDGPSGVTVGVSPILVTLEPSLFEWPILHDDPSFTATFGRILRFEHHILRLAAKTLYALNKAHGLGLEAGKTGVPQSGKFLGVHL